jgi:hypothetical protein
LNCGRQASECSSKEVEEESGRDNLARVSSGSEVGDGRIGRDGAGWASWRQTHLLPKIATIRGISHPRELLHICTPTDAAIFSSDGLDGTSRESVPTPEFYRAVRILSENICMKIH